MPHTYNTSDLVSAGTKDALHSASMLANTVGKNYRTDFQQKSYVSGQTITIEIEPQATFSTGRTGTRQYRKPTTITSTVQQYNGLFSTTSMQKTFDSRGEKDILKFGRTIGLALVRKLERTGFEHGAKYFPAVGTAGTDPGSFKVMGSAAGRIRDQLANTRIYCGLNSSGMLSLADVMKHAPNPSTAITKQYKTGTVKDFAGMYCYESQSTYRHTAGTADNTTPLVDGAPTNGSSTLHIDGTTTGDIATAGTKFTVGTLGGSDAVYAVDPEDGTSLPYLKVFSVVSDSSASTGAGGDVDLTLAEPMYDNTDRRQNVSQLPPNNATITFLQEDEEQCQMGMAYTEDALELISLPLAKDSSGGLKEWFEDIGGLQLRYAIHPRTSVDDTEDLRVDACWVWCSPRPTHGQIILGA